MPKLVYRPQALAQLEALAADAGLKKTEKAVLKALRLLRENPAHPSLHGKIYKGRECPHGDKLFQVYAQNHTPNAYRIHYCRPPGEPDTLMIVDIIGHP